jgi:uncharacterized membrane protein HdeD (DUF308 family)
MTNDELGMVRPRAAGPPAASPGDHRIAHVIEGGILVVLGLLAPSVSPLVGTILFGWLLLISGLVGLIATLVIRRASGFWWSLLSALLAIAVGSLILAQPAIGMVALTSLLIVFLMLEGLLTIMFALDHRRRQSGRWGWLLVSGVLDLALAAVLIGLPAVLPWAMGLIVGINLVFGGVAMIATAFNVRSAAP